MFYGSGAGKLPTASAVVADVIEAAKNPNRNIPMGWVGEKQAIAPMETSEHRYFVRIAGTGQDRKEAVKSAFGQADVWQLDGMHEFSVLTGTMTEETFKKAVEKLDEGVEESFIKQTIRACV